MPTQAPLRAQVCCPACGYDITSGGAGDTGKFIIPLLLSAQFWPMTTGAHVQQNKTPLAGPQNTGTRLAQTVL